MPPRSMTLLSGHPNETSISVTCFLAPVSSPETKTLWAPETRSGSTMRRQFMVLRVFTTRASGKARWTCSPRLSALTGFSRGGIPREESSGLATSMRIFPARFTLPAAFRASSVTVPAVALTTLSPKVADSAKDRSPTVG
jgi:hypothetical protein